MLCLRLLSEKDPAAPLAAAVDALNAGRPADCAYPVDPASFKQVPNAPFAYWVSERIRKIFTELPAFEGDGRTVKQGLATADDFRFVRTAWETLAEDAARAHAERTWFPFAKGGSYSPFYADVFLKVNWGKHGAEIKQGIIQRYPYLNGNAGFVAKNTDYYFRPGLTWPLRTKSFCPQALPSGCIFSVRGYSVLAPRETLPTLLGLGMGQAFDAMFKIFLGRVGHPEFLVGILQLLPVPTDLHSEKATHLAQLAQAAWRTKRAVDTATLTSHAFVAPALGRPSATLREAVNTWVSSVAQATAELESIRAQIDAEVYAIYGLNDADRQTILKGMVGTKAEITESDENEDEEPEAQEEQVATDAAELVSALLDYAVGCALGHWDVRYATGVFTEPPEPDPFDPLPACAAGRLKNAAGLPASAAEVPADYPLAIVRSGVLVDDEHHEADIVKKVREVLALIWPNHAEAIEREACELLGVRNLRAYFQKSTGFFATHLDRHSKGGRQAPIYWPLAGPDGAYTVWLYYPKLTRDTLFAVLRDLVTPKIADEERLHFRLTQEAGPSPTPAQSRELATAEALLADLRTLRDELARVAPLWNPDLNDGVILTHAPLHRLAPHAAWKKKLKDCWDKLTAGSYDWAHLALHLWPDRVLPKCVDDRSLALAHDLDATFWHTDAAGKVASSKLPAADLQKLIAARTSPAVQSALAALLAAPAAQGKSKAGKGKK